MRIAASSQPFSRPADCRELRLLNPFGVFATLLLHAIILLTWVQHGHGNVGGQSTHVGSVSGPLTLLMLDSPPGKKLVNINPLKGLRGDSIEINFSSATQVLPTVAIAAKLAVAQEDIASDPRMISALCRSTYPDPALLAEAVANISLRKSAAPEGPINEGDIDVSKGDRSRAVLAMRCLQAFGSLPPRAAMR